MSLPVYIVDYRVAESNMEKKSRKWYWVGTQGRTKQTKTTSNMFDRFTGGRFSVSDKHDQTKEVSFWSCLSPTNVRQKRSRQRPGISNNHQKCCLHPKYLFKSIPGWKVSLWRACVTDTAYCLFYPNCFAAINQQAEQTGSADYNVIILEPITFFLLPPAFLLFHLSHLTSGGVSASGATRWGVARWRVMFPLISQTPTLLCKHGRALPPGGRVHGRRG